MDVDSIIGSYSISSIFNLMDAHNLNTWLFGPKYILPVYLGGSFYNLNKIYIIYIIKKRTYYHISDSLEQGKTYEA